MDARPDRGPRSDEEDSGEPQLLTLGELAAECCVILGQTGSEIARCSPAFLELIYRTGERRRAREKLLALQVARAGAAGAWGGEEGNRLFATMQEALLRLIRAGEEDNSNG